MANVGAGLMKADKLIGPITEDEKVDQKGTASEARRISTPLGWATYSPASNETVVYAIDGRLWRDFGNHSKNGGQLVQVAAGFLA